MTVLVIVLAISLLINLITIRFYDKVKKEKSDLATKVLQLESDARFYKAVSNLKKEVKKESEEKTQKLNSGDVHSRNSAAADILQNNN